MVYGYQLRKAQIRKKLIFKCGKCGTTTKTDKYTGKDNIAFSECPFCRSEISIPFKGEDTQKININGMITISEINKLGCENFYCLHHNNRMNKNIFHDKAYKCVLDKCKHLCFLKAVY